MIKSSNKNPLNQKEVYNQYLSFKVQDENYCISILDVKEIKTFSQVAKVPNSVEFMTGILNIRGIVVPIFDLKCRFGLGKAEINQNTVVVIVAMKKEVIGIIVDSVSDILNIAANDIQDSNTVQSSISDDFLHGVAFYNGNSYIMLNTDRLFGEEALRAINTAKKYVDNHQDHKTVMNSTEESSHSQ
ncbi:MAG: chemotaxis protein CheW [Alphaproteobacteria bacterium]|nr:chemotaxis protein CheW [Candidatus Jidaibacter sp.]